MAGLPGRSRSGIGLSGLADAEYLIRRRSPERGMGDDTGLADTGLAPIAYASWECRIQANQFGGAESGLVVARRRWLQVALQVVGRDRVARFDSWRCPGRIQGIALVVGLAGQGLRLGVNRGVSDRMKQPSIASAGFLTITLSRCEPAEVSALYVPDRSRFSGAPVRVCRTT